MIGQMRADFVGGGPLAEGRDHTGERIVKPPRDLRFALQCWCERQPLDGWAEIRRDPRFVATRIHAVPAVPLQMDCDESVQEEGGARGIGGQALVAKCRRDPPRAKQGGQQVALGVAETSPMLQHIGCDARDDGEAMIGAMSHGVANPQEKTAGNFLVVY